MRRRRVKGHVVKRPDMELKAAYEVGAGSELKVEKFVTTTKAYRLIWVTPAGDTFFASEDPTSYRTREAADTAKVYLEKLITVYLKYTKTKKELEALRGNTETEIEPDGTPEDGGVRGPRQWEDDATGGVQPGPTDSPGPVAELRGKPSQATEEGPA